MTDLNDANGNNRIYRFSTGALNNPGYNYGFVSVQAIGNNIRQYAITMGGTGANTESISIRSRGSSGTWGNWIKQPTRDEVDALNTETIATAGTIFTPESGISIVSANNNQYKLGKTVSLCFSVKKTDGSEFSGTRVSLGTLATGWRPAVQNNILVPGNKTSGSHMSTIGGTLLIHTNGNISVDIVSNDAKEVQINCTYLQKY